MKDSINPRLKGQSRVSLGDVKVKVQAVEEICLRKSIDIPSSPLDILLYLSRAAAEFFWIKAKPKTTCDNNGHVRMRARAAGQSSILILMP